VNKSQETTKSVKKTEPKPIERDDNDASQ